MEKRHYNRGWHIQRKAYAGLPQSGDRTDEVPVYAMLKNDSLNLKEIEAPHRKVLFQTQFQKNDEPGISPSSIIENFPVAKASVPDSAQVRKKKNKPGYSNQEPRPTTLGLVFKGVLIVFSIATILIPLVILLSAIFLKVKWKYILLLFFTLLLMVGSVFIIILAIDAAAHVMIYLLVLGIIALLVAFACYLLVFINIVIKSPFRWPYKGVGKTG
jgi:hypothetical protein